MLRSVPGISLLIIMLCLSVHAEETVTGVWKTIDDDGKTEKSYVEIYEEDGLINGRIVKLLRKPADSLCTACTGENKDKALVGLKIMSGLQKTGNAFANGKILDPENGKTYNCRIWRDGESLKVRGYVAFFFRTQTWYPVE
ncbi:MAG: DUF2147 domain-containing protein [Desulfobacteraceae bacterium]|nr:DUF2147 domain-containing protein [Desulfobacteraceae bacterium]